MIVKQQETVPTDLVLSPSKQVLGRFDWDETIQPGNHIEFEGQTYQVIERRHQYQLRGSRYHLHKRILQVQLFQAGRYQAGSDRQLIDNQWVIGDSTCQFNARSESLRCAVNPPGPCEGCSFYERPPN